VAASRLPAASQESLLAFFAPVGHAMLVVVAWLMRVSPIAVFALAFAAAREIGLDAARSLVAFGVMTSVVMVAGIVGLSLAAGTLGRVGVGRFFRAAWPAQMVAIATRSSLATVPALVEGARNRLGLSDRVVGFGIPLAASTFKPNRVVSSPGKLFFLGWVYGIPIDPLGYLVFVGYVILLAATTVGVPNQHARHVTLPAYVALGIPVEGAILIASVDMLWDFAASALNSTGYIASTSLLPRRATATVAEPAPEPVAS
jgi:Na+/H+-dicarboxylate symporter